MVMTLTSLVFKSLKKNIKQYYLYFFSLIFSVTLCFSFITLQYNPAVLEQVNKSISAKAGFAAGTFVLYFIVTFFVLYANQLFMKRRSKEIGLYQLMGMTKGIIFRILVTENVVLFTLAVGIGMILGFLTSRFFAMILMKIILNNAIVSLTFSTTAFSKSIVIFAFILLAVIIQTYLVIRRASLLSLFNAAKKSEERIKQFSVFHMIMGIIGIACIAYGYYDSTRLFTPEGATTNNVMINMLIILGTTIFGSYLFFRYSVALIMNLVRKSKRGHLKITDVLGVTTIMHRMKGNAKSLTLITTLTGLAVGIMTLSYISYYSANVSAKEASPFDYMLNNDKGVEFLNQLTEHEIEYEKITFHISQVFVNMKDLIKEQIDENSYMNINENAAVAVVPLSEYQKISPEATLKEREVIITSYVSVLSELFALESNKDVNVKTNNATYPLFIKEVNEEEVFLSNFARQGAPVFVVTDELFKEIQSVQNRLVTSQIGINLVNEKDREQAEKIFNKLSDAREVDGFSEKSYQGYYKEWLSINGINIFVTGFLGLAFLLTTGSILYFKQMGEAEDERESYTVLRKIGFSNAELMQGIYAKQLYNFGMPLVIGLLHSYFAVKSGWFLFGAEMITPMIIIIFCYVAMYMGFALLSILHYKKVVNEALK